MSVNLLLIGANEATTEELVTLVDATLKTTAFYQKATLNTFKNYDPAQYDLIVCFANRYDEMVKRYGHDKVISVEFVPPTDFFVQISRIPEKEEVIIFNNSVSGANVLLKFLKFYNLTQDRKSVV